MDALKGMATHSSILVRRTSWTEEPGGQQSMGSQKSDMTERLTQEKARNLDERSG